MLEVPSLAPSLGLGLLELAERGVSGEFQGVESYMGAGGLSLEGALPRQ